MSTTSIPGPFLHETANERFKRQSRTRVWQAIAAAAALHFAAFAFAAGFTVAGPAPRSEPPKLIPLPDVRLPPPPAPIQPPALPVISEGAPVDVTIPSTRFEHNPAELLPPPPTVTSDPGGFVELAPYMVPPRLLNPDEVERALQRTYPRLLRDAGIGGTVHVHIWLDENGEVVQFRIGRSSGYPVLDEAALRVVEIMRFTPAQNRDRAVRVIVHLPIHFEAR
ncbi:MAG TPA: energy transducer TonB [Vicinamibacterales bacterium]